MMLHILLIVSLVVIFFFSFLFLVGFCISIARKITSKKWEVGDLVKMKQTSKCNSNTLLKLVGWNSDYIFVDDDKLIHRCDWSELEFNKSADWRKNFNSCEKYMGKEPGFTSTVTNTTSTPTIVTYNGKPIDTMTEIECQIYLKMAMEEENFEIAELISKRLQENFK